MPVYKVYLILVIMILSGLLSTSSFLNHGFNFLSNTNFYVFNISLLPTALSQKSLNLSITNNSHLGINNETKNWDLLLIRNNADSGNIFEKLVDLDKGNSMIDYLKDFAIPIAAVIIGGIAASWNFIQSRYRKRAFEKLIFRELEELFPDNKEDRSYKLKNHLNKKFLHKEVLNKFKDEMKNSNFIFDIDPDLVYRLNQLWDAFDNNDLKKWLHTLYQLAEEKDRFGEPKYDKKGDIVKAYDVWLTAL
jgi:hypothetical protein